MGKVFSGYVITAFSLAAAAAALLALDLSGRLAARALLVRAKMPAYKLSSYVKDLEGGEAERAALAERLARRSLAAARAEEYRRENEALRATLGLRVAAPYELIYAPVRERRPELWRKTITVGAGRREGVAPGMAVIGTDGLVGRVTRVTATGAEVELITSERTRVAVRHAPSGEAAVFYADAAARGHLAFLPRRTEVATGDILVTAATSRLYPPGLVVGYVQTFRRPFDSMFAEVEVAPAEELNALEHTFIVKWRPGRGRRAP